MLGNILKLFSNSEDDNINELIFKIPIIYTRENFDADITFTSHVLNKMNISPKSFYESFKNVFSNNPDIVDIQFINGFINVKFSDSFWIKQLKNFNFTPLENIQKKVVIEFLSPNTNKPLHLGHLRNLLLGETLYKIFKYNGNEVIKVCLFNDKGIHICQSMLAWKLWKNGVKPEDENKKGDHYVGDLYVLYHNKLKSEIAELVKKGIDEDSAKQQATLYQAASKMLQLWEAGDQATLELWRIVNEWVYRGFEETLEKVGIKFHKYYYESQVYNLGKDIIRRNLEKNIVKQDEDGSVYIDLTDVGLDKKILLRSDGTSVYITQDIGLIIERYNEYKFDKHIYVVGNEQDYHFKVLFEIIKRFGYDFHDKLYHYSYGMINLPEGKMKSREGKVVDIDDLLDLMIKEVKEQFYENNNKVYEEDYEENIRKIALGAIKYFILKVDPQKNILFNPKESISLDGNTGPFLQYTATRIKTLIKKSNINVNEIFINNELVLNLQERSLIKEICKFNEVLQNAYLQMSPALVCNYLYNLSKLYNNFYQQYPILKENEEIRNFRLYLSNRVYEVLEKGLNILGIEIPSRM